MRLAQYQFDCHLEFTEIWTIKLSAFDKPRLASILSQFYLLQYLQALNFILVYLFHQCIERVKFQLFP